MDISFKIRAEQLGKTLEKLAPAVEEEINQAVKNLSHAAYTLIMAKVQSSKMRDANKKDYLNGLKFTELGDNSYLIHLDGEWANKLEQGYGAYSLRDLLLKSKKIVKVGSRSGEPWVRTAKDGHKWAVVPMEHHPHANPSGDLAKDIKSLMGKSITGHVQNIDKIFKSPDGKPLSGKVATEVNAVNPNLQGLTKYQHVGSGGGVSSVYMTYRAISEAGKDWVHPGSAGKMFFEEAKNFVESELDNIVKMLLK